MCWNSDKFIPFNGVIKRLAQALLYFFIQSIKKLIFSIKGFSFALTLKSNKVFHLLKLLKKSIWPTRLCYIWYRKLTCKKVVAFGILVLWWNNFSIFFCLNAKVNCTFVDQNKYIRVFERFLPLVWLFMSI